MSIFCKTIEGACHTLSLKVLKVNNSESPDGNIDIFKNQ